jgi:hypothetical protein
MNRQRIFEILSTPANLKYDQDMPVVKELIESFPYFPIPHVMLSKLLHDENSIYFDKNLKVGAAYVGNREILYQYINNQPETTLKQPELVEIIDEPELIHATPTVETVPEPVLANPGTSVADQISLESIQPEQDTFIPVEVPESLAVPEEKEIVDSVEKAAPPKEIFSYASFDYLADYKKKHKKIEEPEDELIKDKSTEEKSSISKSHSFSEWFDFLVPGNLNDTRKEAETSQPEPGRSINPDINALIDKFIQTEPRIKPKQTKMYKPEDMARQSAKEDFSIATETLAEIYHKQGLNQKAVEIFHQLILKYPQKSGYFADKIKEIESEDHS